jgi:ABC-type transporter Mla subunit MlaD
MTTLHDTLTTDEARDIIVAQSHTIDDLLTEVTRFRRHVRAQRDLLTDALHALRAGHTDVTDEFIDRVIAEQTRDLGVTP